MEASERDERLMRDAYGHGGETPPAATAAHHDDEHERSGFASTALMLLLGALAVAALVLWLAPRIAPSLPAGVAEYLAPAATVTADEVSELDGRLTSIEGRLGTSIGDINADQASTAARLDEIEQAQRTIMGAIEEQAQAIAAVDEALAAAGVDDETRSALTQAADERGGLDQRMADLEGGLDGMRQEIAAMNQALSEAEQGDGPTVPELSASLSQVQSRVETLAQNVQAISSRLDEQLGGLGQQLDQTISELRAQADQAASQAAQAESDRRAAEEAARQTETRAQLRASLAEVEARLNTGESYAEPLNRIVQAAGQTAPEPLVTHAEEGLPTPSRLAESLSPAANRVLAEERRAGTADGVAGRVTGWFRSQVAGRPTVATEGGGAGAVLSRAEAALRDGNAQQALSEVEALPDAQRQALGDWYEKLASLAAAERALADWRQNIAPEG